MFRITFYHRPIFAAVVLAAAIAPAGACAVLSAPPRPADRQATSPLPPSDPGYELFESKDLDHDGLLDRDELAVGLAPMPADESGRMFDMLDRDRDGRLSLAEYFPDPSSIPTGG